MSPTYEFNSNDLVEMFQWHPKSGRLLIVPIYEGISSVDSSLAVKVLEVVSREDQGWQPEGDTLCP